MAEADLRDTVMNSVFQGISRLSDEGRLWDTRVVVNNETFSCHRLVLASVSKFFKAKFASSAAEGLNGQILIDHEDVTPQSFGLLMDILYNRKDVTTQEMAKDVLKMCVYFEIAVLKKYCKNILVKNLPEECLGVWQLARKYKLPDLAETSWKMTIENIDKVSRKELQTLPKSTLLKLLSLQRNITMDGICKTILSWVEADTDGRAIHLAELLPFVSFPRLSPPYLSELIVYHNHEFRDVIFDYVSEGLNFHLKGKSGKDEDLQRRILTKQTVLDFQSHLVKPHAVVIGGMFSDGKPHQNVYAFELEKNQICYSLPPVPGNMGLHFASCTWRNEIYLSGGTLLPKFFAVYKPADNEWEVLPDLPGAGRGKHAMASLKSSVYVLGGSEKRVEGYKFATSEVLKYDVKSRMWREVCKLQYDIQDASAAVLGHRIYLFGGSNAKGEKTDLVHCLDTLSNVTYICGSLPFPSCGSRALSNGGTIWVILPTGEVLQMYEFSDLAEKREKIVASQRQPTKECATVQFLQVSSLSPRSHFGACLAGNELDMIVCGGLNVKGDLLSTVERVHLSGSLPQKKASPVLVTGTAHLDLHALNIPQVHLNRGVISALMHFTGTLGFYIPFLLLLFVILLDYILKRSFRYGRVF